jgi:hypothetical protein
MVLGDFEKRPPRRPTVVERAHARGPQAAGGGRFRPLSQAAKAEAEQRTPALRTRAAASRIVSPISKRRPAILDGIGNRAPRGTLMRPMRHILPPATRQRKKNLRNSVDAWNGMEYRLWVGRWAAAKGATER